MLTPILLFVAVFTSLAVTIGLGVAYLGRRFGYPKVGIGLSVVAGVAFFMLAVGPSFSFFVSATQKEGIGVTPGDANDSLSVIDVPTEATDVNYLYAPLRLLELADFQMKESDFLKWMDRQSWPPRPFATQQSSGIPQWVNGSGSMDFTDTSIAFPDTYVYPVKSEGHVVKNGYHFTDVVEPGFPGITIIYDTDNQRVYVLKSPGE